MHQKRMALLLLILLTAACTKAADPLPPPAEPGTVYVSRQDLFMQARLEPKEVPQSEPVTVRVKVMNRSAASVAYVAADGCDKGIRIRIEGTETWLPLVVDGPSMGCTDAIEIRELKPGAALEAKYLWDGILGGMPASAGSYKLSVSFNAGEHYEDIDPLTLYLDLVVTGGRVYLSAADAAARAAADGRVMAWREAHTGDSIVRKTGEKWEVLMARSADDLTGEWTSVRAELAEAALTLQPEVTSSFANGRWEVRLGTKLGPAPRQATAVVNAETGEVIAVSFK